MGEISRQRRSRDLWISRQHLWALGAAIILLVGCSFFLGLGLSKGQAAAPVASGPTSDAPDESLVDLLARVDARVVSQNGVDTLTFPDTLTGLAEDPGVPVRPDDDPNPSRVAPGEGSGAAADLVLTLTDEADVELMVADLRARGWQISRLESAPLVVRLRGGADVSEAQRARDRLAAELERLELQPKVDIQLR